MTLDEVGDLGMRNAIVMARESGSADPGHCGWDGLLINALGRSGVCRLFGEPESESEDGWSAAMAFKLVRYNMAAQTAAQNVADARAARAAWEAGTR